MPHPFDESIHLAPTADDTWAGATHPAYANMIGPYGGTTCAVLLRAVLLHAARQGDPIALTVNYAAPIADGAYVVQAQPLRTNRSTQHWAMQLAQGGEVCASGTAVLAVRRPTWSAPEAEPPVGMPAALELPRAPAPRHPPWISRYDMRFEPRQMPRLGGGVEQTHSRTRQWVRDEPPRALDYASLAAICDVFFPRVMLRRGRPAPIGTISLTTYFHAGPAQLSAQADRHVLGTARGLNFRDGYFDQSAEVWGDDGTLLASSHQMVYFRE